LLSRCTGSTAFAVLLSYGRKVARLFKGMGFAVLNKQENANNICFFAKSAAYKELFAETAIDSITMFT